MKKFISAALVVAMAAASCADKEDLGITNNNDNNPVEQPAGDGSRTFSADFAEPIAKATPNYNESTHAVTVLWEQNDKVGVYAADGAPAEFTAQAPGASTTLNGNIIEADTYYAMYPYDAEATIAAGQISTALPATQTATADAFMAHLAVASTSGSSFSFMNVCGLVRVYVGCEHVTRIEFKGNAAETVAGAITVNAATAEYALAAEGGEKVITVTPPADAATFETGAYYFSVLPQNFASGFTVTYYTTNGNADSRATSAVNVPRSNLVVGKALTDIEGTGSYGDPFIIANVHDLCCLSEVLSTETANYVELSANIDMSGVTTWTPINNDRTAANVRTIHFDGNDYTISNFAPTIFANDPNGKTNYSLFGILYGSCKDLTVENATIDQATSSTTAVLAAYAGYPGVDDTYTTLIENVHVSGVVNANKVVAGFAGDFCNVKFVNCSADVEVTASDYHVGGFVARSSDSGKTDAVFENCCATGDVTCTKTNKGKYTGGFYGGSDGSAAKMTFTRCYSTGDVVTDMQMGGFIGFIDTDHTVALTDCYSTCQVSVISNASNGKQVGGLIGATKGTLTVERCYFSGQVTANGESVGGILALSATGTTQITNSFAISDLTSQKYVGGIVGYHKSTSLEVDNCFASGTLSASRDVGGIVGWAEKTSTVKNCKHNANVDAVIGTETVAATQQNNAKLTAEEAANYATASAIATQLGWDGTTTWNLTGATPTLKCFEN